MKLFRVTVPIDVESRLADLKVTRQKLAYAVQNGAAPASELDACEDEIHALIRGRERQELAMLEKAKQDERDRLAAAKQQRAQSARLSNDAFAKVAPIASGEVERPVLQMLEGIRKINALQDEGAQHFLAAGGDPGIRNLIVKRRRAVALSIVRRVLDELGAMVNPMLLANNSLYGQGIWNASGEWTPLAELIVLPKLTTVDDHEREGVSA